MHQTLLSASKLDDKVKEELLNLIKEEILSLFDKIIKTNKMNE